MSRLARCILLAAGCLNAVAALLFLRVRPVWVLPVFALEAFAASTLFAYRRVSRHRRTMRLPRRLRPDEPSGVDPRTLARSATRRGAWEQWLAWRRAAQDVTRAWNEWSAADHADRAQRYRQYSCALAAEEQAATELEIAESVTVKAAALECSSDAAGSVVSHPERSEW